MVATFYQPIMFFLFARDRYLPKTWKFFQYFSDEIFPRMSLIEGIGDDLLGVCLVLSFLVLISLAWLSTHVYLPNTFVQIESTRNNLELFEQPSISLLSANETFSEQEFELSTSELEQYASEPILRHTTSMEEEQVLRITIKFLNETQKLICVNANDTIWKIKR